MTTSPNASRRINYRESGLPWLGKIPWHWGLHRLKFHMSRIEQGWSPQCDSFPANDDEWGVLKVGAVNGAEFNPDENKRLPYDMEPLIEYEVRVGDLLMSRANTTQLLGRAALVRSVRPRLIFCDKHYRLTVDNSVLSPEFLVYFLRSTVGHFEFERDATGASNSMQNIGQDSVQNVWIPVPPLETQQRISSYLDRETGRIDELIAAKERLLALLAEKRLALITHAITRGLNPHVPLQDSGLPWLGKIPAHWQVERSKWLLKERDERSESGDEELLTVSHITGVTPRTEKDVTMFEAETTEGYKICKTGDLAVNTMWAFMGAMGVSPVDGIVSPAYNVYIPIDDYDPTYVDLLVRTPHFCEEVRRHSKGVWSSRLRLYPEGLYEICLPLPPLIEQHQIVQHLLRHASRTDAVEQAAKSSIELLRERRSAVIAAAVTGELEVEA